VRRRSADAFVVGEEQLVDDADCVAPAEPPPASSETTRSDEALAPATARVSAAPAGKRLRAACQPVRLEPPSGAARRRERSLRLPLRTAATTVGIAAAATITTALALHGAGDPGTGPVGSERSGSERVFARRPEPRAPTGKPEGVLHPTSEAAVRAGSGAANGATGAETPVVVAPTPAPVPAPVRTAQPGPAAPEDPVEPASPAVVQREFGP
jgi:hypothetical protein